MAVRLDISAVHETKSRVQELGGRVNVSQFGAVDYKGRSIDLLVVEEQEDGTLKLCFRKLLGEHDGVLYTKPLKPTPAQINKLLKAFLEN